MCFSNHHEKTRINTLPLNIQLPFLPQRNVKCTVFKSQSPVLLTKMFITQLSNNVIVYILNSPAVEKWGENVRKSRTFNRETSSILQCRLHPNRNTTLPHVNNDSKIITRGKMLSCCEYLSFCHYLLSFCVLKYRFHLRLLSCRVGLNGGGCPSRRVCIPGSFSARRGGISRLHNHQSLSVYARAEQLANARNSYCICLQRGILIISIQQIYRIKTTCANFQFFPQKYHSISPHM